jgi:hypothetical protein
MAWHFKEYPHEQRTQERLVYRDEEEAAKAASARSAEGCEADVSVGVAEGEALT